MKLIIKPPLCDIAEYASLGIILSADPDLWEAGTEQVVYSLGYWLEVTSCSVDENGFGSEFDEMLQRIVEDRAKRRGEDATPSD
jgi:hypothetical protein